MAAPTYATDLTDIFTDGTTTGWTALGGGPAGLNQETDYFIQGTSCLSKNAWASAVRGMIYAAGATTIAAGDCLWMWITHQTANSLDTLANGGIQVLIGSGTGDYYHYYVGGSNTIRYDDRWLCVPIDPRTGTVSVDNTTGTPTTTRSHFGGLAAMVGGPTKGSPFGIDAIRHGRVFTCTNGDVTNGYASFGGNGSDAGAAAYNDAVTRSWGQIQYSGGTYKMQGLFAMGSIVTAVDFRDSNRVVFVANTLKVASTFNGFEITNSSSNVEWTNISVSALGTVSRGYFTVNSSSNVDLTACTFTDMSTFSFDSNTTATDTTFRRCDLVTQNSATLTGCLFASSTATASVLSNNPSNISDCTFSSDGSNHAIQLTSATAGNTYNLDGCTFTGYATSNGSTGNEVIYNNSGGAVTLNLSNTTGIVSVRNGTGASTTINNNVNVTITVQDAATNVIAGAQVALFKSSDDSTLQASTATNQNGQVVASVAASSGAFYARIRLSTNTASFLTTESSSNGIQAASDYVHFSSNHNFSRGEKVIYSKEGGSQTTGLTDGNTYYLYVVDANTVSVHSTVSDGYSGTSPINLSSGGSETHEFQPIRYIPTSTVGTIGTTDVSLTVTLQRDTTATV